MTTLPQRLWPNSQTILERSKNVFLQQWKELLRIKRQAMQNVSPTVVSELGNALHRHRFRAALELFIR